MSDTCQIGTERGALWARDFRARSARARQPISATLELTHRCNLRCIHCYLGDAVCGGQADKTRERTTAEVKAALDEWAEAGVLYLLLTGGDPMMRRDFAEIYSHARRLGMLVTVYCDGILVTDSIIALFKELPPRNIEISIYGATAATYEGITRVPGSFAKAWRGIRLLKDNDIPLSLKTILMTPNEHELEAMEAQAARLGVPFRYDAAIFPCLHDSSQHPLQLRISPESVVRHDMATPERKAMWREKIEKTAAVPDSDQLYTCGAGLSAFYADPFGHLAPCLLAQHYGGAQGNRSFRDVWNSDLAELRSKRNTAELTSFKGALRGACTHCPAMNFIETGDEQIESEYMKEIARRRYDAVMESPCCEESR